MIDRLRRLAEISPLPAWGSTAALWLILMLAAFGVEPARGLWHDDSGPIITVYLAALGLWLGSKKIPNRAAAKDPTAGQG